MISSSHLKYDFGKNDDDPFAHGEVDEMMIYIVYVHENLEIIDSRRAFSNGKRSESLELNRLESTGMLCGTAPRDTAEERCWELEVSTDVTQSSDIGILKPIFVTWIQKRCHLMAHKYEQRRKKRVFPTASDQPRRQQLKMAAEE